MRTTLDTIPTTRVHAMQYRLRLVPKIALADWAFHGELGLENDLVRIIAGEISGATSLCH